MKKVSVIYPKKIGQIAPEIYGHFSEHIGGVFYDGLWVGKDSDIPNINGFRKAAIDKLKAINIPVLRWPGGCYAEIYNWRDGIGENRPVRRNWWTKHDGRFEPNSVGTHEFIELCELIGAKPYFAVNVTSATPRDAWEWMDYCLSPKGSTTLALEREKNGHPEPFDIPFWGIGNENWGGGGNMTPEYYALEFRRFATVLEYMGFNVELFAGGANGADYAWTRGLASLLQDKKELVDAMSIHYYCSGNWEFGEKDPINFTDEGWFKLLEGAEKMEDIIIRHHATAQSYKMEEKLKLVIDEWGCWHAEGSGPSKGYNLFEQQSTMRDALVAATTLNIFNRHADKIRMANLAQVANNIQCLFLTEGEKFTVTPTYHVFDMYKEHQGATSLDAVVSDNTDVKSRVTVSASEKNGKLLVTLANYAFEDTEIELDILGASTAKKANVQTLRCDDIRACNTFENPERIAPVSADIDLTSPLVLPAASVVALTVDLL